MPVEARVQQHFHFSAKLVHESKCDDNEEKKTNTGKSDRSEDSPLVKPDCVTGSVIATLTPEVTIVHFNNRLPLSYACVTPNTSHSNNSLRDILEPVFHPPCVTVTLEEVLL